MCLWLISQGILKDEINGFVNIDLTVNKELCMEQEYWKFGWTSSNHVLLETKNSSSLLTALESSFPFMYPYSSLPFYFVFSCFKLRDDYRWGWVIDSHTQKGKFEDRRESNFYGFLRYRDKSYILPCPMKSCVNSIMRFEELLQQGKEDELCVCACVYGGLWSNTMYVVVASISEYIVRIDVSYAYLVL